MSANQRPFKWVVGAMAVWTFGLGGALVAVHGAWASKVDAVGLSTITQTTVIINSPAPTNEFTEGGPGAISAGTMHDTGAPDCTADISWGDGSTSPATLVSLGGGDFMMSGTHTYAEEGSYFVVATSTDPDCNWPTTTSTTTIGSTVIITVTVRKTESVDVANCCEPLAVTGNAIVATAGSLFSGAVATFTDPDPPIPAGSSIQENDSPAIGPPSSYTATITWGDSSTSPGTVASDGSGGFVVTGTHTYPNAGSFPLSVSVTDTDNSIGAGSATATVNGNCGRPFNVGSVQLSIKLGPGQFVCVSVARPPNSIVITAPPPSVKTTFGGITLVLPPPPATLASTPPVMDTITSDGSAIVAPGEASLGLCPASQDSADPVFPDLGSMFFGTTSSARAPQLHGWNRCR